MKRSITILAVSAALCAPLTGTALATGGPPPPTYLYTGQTMQNGDYLQNGSYDLEMNDGNLELYKATTLLFESNTGGHPSGYLKLLSGGNLVIYTGADQPIWETFTAGVQVNDLHLQYGGDLVLETLGGTVRWETSTDGGAVRTNAAREFDWAVSDAILDPIQYSWGGGHLNAYPGPSYGTAQGANIKGLDCSGFARWVYAQSRDDQRNTSYVSSADPLGPGNTNAEIAEMAKRASAADAVIGDLVFWGYSNTNSQHVGVYIGNGQVVDNYATGTSTRVDDISSITNPPSHAFLGYWHL